MGASCEQPFREGVSAPNRLAAEAGAAVLAKGGSAAEAAVATAAALAVVYPHMNSIGGDSFWLIKRKGCAPQAIMACGQAAQAVSPSWYRKRKHKAVPARGPLACVTVPGTVRGWEALLTLPAPARRLTLSEILAPAVTWAREGFPVSASQVRTTAPKLTDLKRRPGFASVFLQPNGRAYAQGDTLVQTALADTLETLAQNGVQDFYTGEVAARMCRELAQLGSPLTADDFASCRARTAEPLHLNALGCDLYNVPAPTQGIVSLMILGVMERLAADPRDPVGFVHAAVEASKLIFAWRDHFIGDPAHMRVDVTPYLTKPSLRTMASLIRTDCATGFVPVSAKGDTVWFGVVDKDGTAVSAIQSIYWEYGSGVVLQDSGVTMQNRGCAFNFNENHPNCLRPGAVPFHTLNPAMAVTADNRVIAYGTMGGDGQPQTQTAVLLRHLAGMSLEEAIAAPRWLYGRTWGETSSRLRLESRFDPIVAEGLRALGHDVEVLAEPFSDLMGHAGALSLTAEGLVQGASDPRSDGAFVGL
mgnify:FL=1